MNLVLLLAAMCVAEVDFHRPRECVEMWGVNAKRAHRRGIHLDQQVRSYNSIFRTDRRGRYLVNTDRAKWVRDLRQDGSEPNGYPRHRVPWKFRRPRWLGILVAAQAYLDNPPPFPRADHYGGDCADVVGACDKVPKCWSRLTVNFSAAQAYWRVPPGACKLDRVHILR